MISFSRADAKPSSGTLVSMPVFSSDTKSIFSSPGVRTRCRGPIKLFKYVHIFLSFVITGYNLLSYNWLKCHIMYLWLIWQEGGGVFLVSLTSVLLFRMTWLASLMLNTSESQSETRGTSVPAPILKVSRNSWHLAIQCMGLQAPWIKYLKLYKHLQIISVKSSSVYRVLKALKKQTIVVIWDN